MPASRRCALCESWRALRAMSDDGTLVADWGHSSASDNCEAMHPGAIRCTYLVDVIARRPRKVPLLSEPVPLDFHLEATLDDRVARQLGKRALRKLIDLSGIQV